MDKLENYILDHRDGLDVKEPNGKLWERIENELDQRVKRRWIGISNSFIWKAASIILFIMIIGLLIDRKYNQPYKDQVTNIGMPDINLAEVESYYIGLIDVKQKEITDYINKYPELDTRFLNDLNTLDANYQQLKNELNAGYNERILNAMIQNLQMQTEILNQQMEIIENIKTIKQNETVQI